MQLGGNGQNGYLGLSGAVTLAGGGTVTLDTIANNGGDAYIFGSGETLTNSNNTIQGTGIIGEGSLVLINDGVVDATPEGGTSTLTLNGGGVTNTSTMEASAGGALVIETTVNNAGGNITTADGTSTVEVDGGTVQGGTLNTAPAARSRRPPALYWTGLFTAPDDEHRQRHHRGGQYHHASAGTFNNAGTIVQVGGSGQNGYLSLAGAVNSRAAGP